MPKVVRSAFRHAQPQPSCIACLVVVVCLSLLCSLFLLVVVYTRGFCPQNDLKLDILDSSGELADAIELLMR
eukprot:COSAG05_NODE_19073_length_298_cov_0.768844_1_plen_71_part_10